MATASNLQLNETNIQTPAKPDGLAGFGRNLRQFRHAIGWTLDQLASATGISKPYLSNIETARLTGPPAPDKLERLEKALNLPSGTLAAQADWLRTPQTVRDLLSARPPTGNPPASSSLNHHNVPRRADGAVDLDQLLKLSRPAVELSREFNRESGSQSAAGNSAGSSVGPLLRIPLINRVAAGKAAEFTDLDYPAGIADSYITAPAPAETTAATAASSNPDAGLFALRIDGDSMEPRYHQGDIVVFSSTQTPQSGDDCLVRLDDSENFSTTFKRVEFAAGSIDAPSDPDAPYLTLVPLNPAYPRRLLRHNQISGLYPAVWRITPANSRNLMPDSAPDPSPEIQSNALQPAMRPHENPQNSPQKHRRRGRKAAAETTPHVSSPQPTVEPPAVAASARADWNSNRFSLEND